MFVSSSTCNVKLRSQLTRSNSCSIDSSWSPKLFSDEDSAVKLNKIFLSDYIRFVFSVSEFKVLLLIYKSLVEEVLRCFTLIEDVMPQCRNALYTLIYSDLAKKAA